MTEKKTQKKPAARETAERPKAAKPKAAPPKSAQPKAGRTVRITLLKSPIGASYRHKATLAALGLKRIRQTVEQAETPQLRGMLAKVGHMVKVDAGTGKEKPS